MDSKVTNGFREAVLPCIRLVQMMMAIDRMAGLLYILCWCLDIVQDIVLVWIDSRTYTMTQQMFSNSAARKEIFSLLVRFWVAKLTISFGLTCVRRFQSGLEKRIKKVMRQKMTVLLLESFSSLDYVTQSNPGVIRQFKDGDRIFQGSVIRRAADVLSITMYLARVILLCLSLATQIRGRDELLLIPVVLLILGIQACNRWRKSLLDVYLMVELWSSNVARSRNRGSGKTKYHRRRDALRFPYMPAEFRREAVLRNLGPWVTGEYTKASNVLMNKPLKELRMKRERAQDFYQFFHSVTREFFSISLILLGLPVPLATFNLMLATLTSLGTNLSNLTFFCDYLGTSYLPSIRSYFECIDMRRPIHQRIAARPLQRNAAGFDLKGENITFHYPHQPDTEEDVKYPSTLSQSKPALQDMSFHFEAGKMHALVGDNGCGKTTLVQLISQLHTNFSGRITLNGHNIKDYDINEVRSHVSVMFQDIAKLQRFSVFENIGIGDVNALAMNHGAIETVAAEHKVTDFISLNTVIGDLHQVHKDPGEKWQAELSGGQWQKIALARTFLKGKDADLIILDEPTSALDVHAEHEFFQQLKTLRKGKTTIFITHKYVTTATADCIHFMKKGKIVERGNHAELMASNGEYARRYTLQTQGYTETGVGESV